MITTPVKIWRRGKKISSHIGKKGEIVQWTVVRVPPKSFSDQAPYPVVLVKLENGEKMIGQLVDWNETDLKSGREVVAIMRRIVFEDTDSVISYGIKFKPL